MKWMVLVCLALAVAGCGKSQEKEAARDTAVPADSSSASGVAGALATRGFAVVGERAAPSQRSGHRAALVTYRSADGVRGGVVYVLRPLDGTGEQVGWHWYFADAAPDSAALVEINRDGLWDARVYFGGRALDMVQGEAFSLLGRGHAGAAAMNGASSSAADLWKCFDGDSTTAWRSPARKAFIELPLPLGAARAELDVQLAERNRPRSLDVYAGDRKLQSIDLPDGIMRQTYRLDPAARDAGAIRIEVKGGESDSVAISELEIR